MKLIIPAAAVAIGIWLSRSKSTTTNTLPVSGAVSDLIFLIKNVGFGWEGVTPLLKINTYIQNPTSKQFICGSMKAKIFVNGVLYGEASSFGNKTVLPGTETEYPLQLRLSVGQAYNDLMAMIEKQKSYSVELKLQGTVSIDGATYPMNLTHVIV